LRRKNACGRSMPCACRGVCVSCDAEARAFRAMQRRVRFVRCRGACVSCATHACVSGRKDESCVSSAQDWCRTLELRGIFFLCLCTKQPLHLHPLRSLLYTHTFHALLTGRLSRSSRRRRPKASEAHTFHAPKPTHFMPSRDSR
jgi:hypothetical protein